MDYKLRIVLLVERKRQEISELPGLTSAQTEKLVNYLATAGLLKLSSKSKRKHDELEEREDKLRKKLRKKSETRAAHSNGKHVEPGFARASHRFDPSVKTEVSSDDDCDEFDLSSSASTGSKLEHHSKHRAAPTQNASSKAATKRAFLLASLQGNLASLKPWLAKGSPNELSQLQTRLSPQSFAIVQLLARADPKPTSPSSSSPSDESSSSSPRLSSEDGTESPPLLTTMNERSLLGNSEDLRNYNLSSGRSCRTYPPSATSSSGPSRSLSAVAAPPPNDHDYYSVRPHNGSLR